MGQCFKSSSGKYKKKQSIIVTRRFTCELEESKLWKYNTYNSTTGEVLLV